jgi:hypothetical protein
MKTAGLVVALAVSLGVVALPASAGVDAPTELSTGRHVHGVITSIEPSTLTIASAQRAVTAKIDPSRTRVTIHGHPGTVADLKLTAHARGEVCLDDVWLAVDLH